MISAGLTQHFMYAFFEGVVRIYHPYVMVYMLNILASMVVSASFVYHTPHPAPNPRYLRT